MSSKSRSKILMVNDNFHFGGGGDTAFRLEKKILEDAGYEVCTYTFTYSHKHMIEDNKGINDYVYRESSSHFIRKVCKFTFNPFVYYSLKKCVKEIKPDFVHLHLISKYPASVYAALIGYPAAQTLHGPNHFCATAWGCLKKDSSPCELGVGLKCYRRKCVPFIQAVLHWWLYVVDKKLAKKCVKLFTGPTRQICEVSQNMGFVPVEYLPLCIDHEFVVSNGNDIDGPPTVVFVGWIAEYKGVEYLLDAFRLVKKELAEAKLIFAGRGPLLPKLKEKSREYEIQDSVEFLGFVEHDKIRQVYRRGHVFAMPSIWSEQFGLVGPEAIMCGLPCVGTDIGGIPEWLKDEHCGFLVPPRDVQALAEKLLLLLNNKQLRQDYAQKGKKYILEKYGAEKFRDNILNLAERMIDNRNKCGS